MTIIGWSRTCDVPVVIRPVCIGCIAIERPISDEPVGGDVVGDLGSEERRNEQGEESKSFTRSLSRSGRNYWIRGASIGP